MKVLTLDRKIVTWYPSGMSTSDQRPKSSYHEAARKLLKEKYSTMSILEEVSIPVRTGQTCYLDFYIPLLKKAVEAHGEQHYQMSYHFHGSLKGFANQRKRDNEKVEWCDINNIELVILAFDDMEGWGELI